MYEDEKVAKSRGFSKRMVLQEWLVWDFESFLNFKPLLFAEITYVNKVRKEKK